MVVGAADVCGGSGDGGGGIVSGDVLMMLVVVVLVVVLVMVLRNWMLFWSQLFVSYEKLSTLPNADAASNNNNTTTTGDISDVGQNLRSSWLQQ